MPDFMKHKTTIFNQTNTTSSYSKKISYKRHNDDDDDDWMPGLGSDYNQFPCNEKHGRFNLNLMLTANKGQRFQSIKNVLCEPNLLQPRPATGIESIVFI
jgi:hypothetical protein